MSRSFISLLVVFASFFLATKTSFAQGGAYGAPPGGWMYGYEANAGEDAAGADGSGFTSLDGTWSHDNGSDEWDGSKLGADGKPGGAEIIDGSYLRIQDTGDPRDHGFSPDPSNRKVYFGHNLSADGASDTLLDDGGPPTDLVPLLPVLVMSNMDLVPGETPAGILVGKIK